MVVMFNALKFFSFMLHYLQGIKFLVRFFRDKNMLMSNEPKKNTWGEIKDFFRFLGKNPRTKPTQLQNTQPLALSQMKLKGNSKICEDKSSHLSSVSCDARGWWQILWHPSYSAASWSIKKCDWQSRDLKLHKENQTQTPVWHFIVNSCAVTESWKHSSLLAFYFTDHTDFPPARIYWALFFPAIINLFVLFSC